MSTAGGRIVIVKSDGSDGSGYPVEGHGGSIDVGSDKDCAIRFPSKGFPRRQCNISVRDRQAIVKSLSSESATYVNDVPIDTAILKHGDVISFGKVKFRWEYGGRSNRKSAVKKKSANLLVKRSRKSFNGRHSKVSAVKKSDAHIVRYSTGSGHGTMTGRKIAVVMPQMRCTAAASNSVEPSTSKLDRQRIRNKSDGFLLGGRTSGRKVTETSNYKNSYTTGKKKRSKVEKLEDPIITDKNKRAALMLLTGRSPVNRELLKSASIANKKPLLQSDTKKTLRNSVNASSLPSKVNRSFNNPSKPAIRLSMRKTQAEFKMKPIIEQKSRIPVTERRIPTRLMKSIASPRNARTGRRNIVDTSIKNSPAVCAALDESKNSKTPKTNVPNDLEAFNMSGVEIINDNESLSSHNPSVESNLSAVSLIVNVSKTPLPRSARFSSCESNSAAKAPSVKRFTGTVSPEIGVTENTSNGEPLLVSFISSLTNALNVLNDSNSFINVETVLKTPEFQALNHKIKSAGKTLDFSIGDSPKILEIGRPSLRKSTRKNLSQEETVATKPSRNASLGDSMFLSSINTSSPIFSSDRSVENASGSDSETLDMNLSIDIISTPNLSKVFSAKASTPMEPRRSVRDKIRHFEALEEPILKRTTSKRPSGVISEAIQKRKSRFERCGSMTIPKKKMSTIVKAKNRRSLPNRLNSDTSRVSDEQSDNSNATDVNAPKPDNEIIITPKSTVKPAPEALKEKHSTAKKPISRKTMIDHLTQSPEIVKELFKSPVKRKLSKSIKFYNHSHTFDDFKEIETPAKITRRSSKLATSFDVPSSIVSKESPLNNTVPRAERNSRPTTNMSISVVRNMRILETPEPVKSSKNDLRDVQGVKKFNICENSPRNSLNNTRGLMVLLTRPKPNISPKNNLKFLMGLKQLLKTPEAVPNPRPQRSPRNELLDMRGVKKLLATPRPRRTPKNDLTDIRGVKELMATPKPSKIPKNDLTDVKGVKKLMATPIPCKTPKNDLSDVRGLRLMMTSPKVVKSPKNDLRNVAGVKKMFNPPIVKSPKNDLRNVAGVKRMFNPPIVKSPKNDLTDVRGVKKFYDTPRPTRSPKNTLTDLKGVKQLLKTPRVAKSPKNTLTDVAGVKRLLRTPRIARSPENNLLDVEGVKALFELPEATESPKSDLLRTPKNPKEDDFRSFKTPIWVKSEDALNTSEVLFDSLVGKPSLKTYSNSKKRLSSSFVRLESPPVAIQSEETTVGRSRRQATIDKTNYSLEVSKVLSVKRENRVDKETSMLGQSTPAVKEKRILIKNEISLQLSPILGVVKESLVTPVAVKNTKRLRGKKEELKSDKPVRETNQKLKRGLLSKENAGCEVKPKVKTQKKTKSKKVDENVSEETIKKESDLNGSKKKVTFASDVQDEDGPRSPSAKKVRPTRSTNCKVPEALPLARATRGKSKVQKEVTAETKPKRGKNPVKIEESDSTDNVKSTRSKRGAAKVIQEKPKNIAKTESVAAVEVDLPQKGVKRVSSRATTAKNAKIPKIEKAAEKSKIKTASKKGSPVAKKSAPAKKKVSCKA